MKVLIKGKNIEITEGIRSNIEEHLFALGKYFKNDDLEINVNVKTYSDGQKIEVTIPVDEKNIIRQEVTAIDLYEAIAIATKKLDIQIRKTKDIAATHKNTRKELLNYLQDLEAKAEVVDKVEKRKDIEMLPMTEDEAILQFELMGHDFYAFIDGLTEETKIIYKRKDNGFGILVLK